KKSGKKQGWSTAKTSFKQVLQYRAKEKFFGDGNEEECEQHCANYSVQADRRLMKMDETHGFPGHNREGDIENQFAIVAGESVGFIHLHPAADDLDRVIGAVLLTFLLIA